MNDLGEFFFTLSLRKRQNFLYITDFCTSKTENMVDALNSKLMDILCQFETLKLTMKLTPTHSYGLALGERTLSVEEEKHSGDVMMIDTGLTPAESK